MTDPDHARLKAHFQPRIQAELAELRTATDATAADRKPVALDQQSVGRLSRMDAMQQQAMASAQNARRKARIRALDAALRRLEGDDFGWCDGCGDFIGLKRLELDPTVMRCRDCAR